MSGSIWYTVPRVEFRADYSPEEIHLLENEFGHITHIEDDRYFVEYDDEGLWGMEELEPFFRKAKGNYRLTIRLSDGIEVFATDVYSFGNGSFDEV